MKTKICSGAFHDLITFKQDTHNNYSCQSDVFSKKLKEEKHIKIKWCQRGIFSNIRNNYPLARFFHLYYLTLLTLSPRASFAKLFVY